MLILRVVILLVGVHCYVFLSAFIYHYLEKPDKVPTVNNVERVVENNLLSGARPKKSKEEIVADIRLAVTKDNEVEMRKAFNSLWKCYLFSLTTITTLGNSGLYLQTPGSRLFFIFTTIIGTVLYLFLIHHIGIILLTVFQRSIDFSSRSRLDERQRVKFKSFAKFSVLLLSYFISFCSLLIMGLGAVFSGNGYLFGLYAIFDSALTVGNFSILTYVYPWNEIGFVLSVNLMLLMGLSVLYTSVYLTFQYGRGSDFNELIDYWWDHENKGEYEMVNQEEERPFQKFLAQSKIEETAKVREKKHEDKVPLFRKEDDKNPFLDEDDDVSNGSTPERGQYFMTPAFLSTDAEIQADNNDDSSAYLGTVQNKDSGVNGYSGETTATNDNTVDGINVDPSKPLKHQPIP